ncbi:MAG TPA: hypothetical protein VGC32_13470 [Solirubrobacterales bacterium]
MLRVVGRCAASRQPDPALTLDLSLGGELAREPFGTIQTIGDMGAILRAAD